MRAMRCHELSQDPGVLRLDELTLPPPGPGEVKLRLRACAANFPDLLMVQGGYQFKPPLPFAPGLEAAGDVIEVGEGVDAFTPGDRVVARLRYGGFAEEAIVSHAQLRPLPANLDYVHGAAYTVTYLTAYVALVERGMLQPGEVLLVHGAGGGVGLAAVEVGKLLGATVIATASSEAKCAAAREKGADHALLYRDGFRDQVKALTDGRGADVIFDPVGGDVFDESMRCINWEGRLLIIGFTGGRFAQVPTNLVLIKNISVVGVRAGEQTRRDPSKGRRALAAIDQWAEEGRIRPHVCATLPLEQAADALRMLERREVIGKVVVVMPPL